VGNLGFEGTSPARIIMLPSSVVVSDTPWVSDHVHFVENSGCISVVDIEDRDQGVGVGHGNST